jgi:hypothetical protein
MEAFALVDYDNLPSIVQQAGLHNLAHQIDVVAQAGNPGLSDLHIRLYGGWYTHAGLTNKGTLLSQAIGATFPIPLMASGGTRRYLRCEIASALLCSPADIFYATLRQRAGMRSRLTAKTPIWCANPGGCTIQASVRWSRGSCSVAGCSVVPTEAFEYYEQKLVDTLLCCDLVYLSLAQNDPIYVISDDDDMTPAILMASKYANFVSHLRRPPVVPRVYDPILVSNKVRIEQY